MFIKVADDIYLVGGTGYSDSGDCCVYLVNSNPSVLIDAGLNRNAHAIIDNIYESGLNPADIKYLILTHCHIDHTGGANYLRETTGAKIIAHTNDAEPIIRGETVLTAANWYNIQPIPTNIDIRIEGDSGQIENIPRIKWYHIPGHTPGSIALLYEKDNIKILFGQDIHGPLSPLFKSDREDYLKSLEMLIGLNADILCEGHYGIIRGKNNVKDFIARFINTGGQE